MNISPRSQEPICMKQNLSNESNELLDGGMDETNVQITLSDDDQGEEFGRRTCDAEEDNDSTPRADDDDDDEYGLNVNLMMNEDERMSIG